MSTVSPRAWVDAVAKADRVEDWDALYAMHRGINQSFVDAGDDRGLEKFHEEALRLCADARTFERVRVKDLHPFEKRVQEILAEGVATAREDPSIHGLYFEYFYDGGDTCEGNLFLCLEYSSDDDDWASQFDEMIEGPQVGTWLGYDPELEFEPPLFTIAERYVDGMFLAAAMRAWRQAGSPEIPFGFAQHDAAVVRVNAPKS